MNNKQAKELKKQLLRKYGEDVSNCYHQTGTLTITFKIEESPAELFKHIGEQLESLPKGCREIKAVMTEDGYKMYTGSLLTPECPTNNAASGTESSNVEYEQNGIGVIPGLDLYGEPDA